MTPITRLDIIRALIALATKRDEGLISLIFKYNFLNEVLEEEIYVEKSLDIIVKGNKDKVLKLKRTLYGLKQVN
jgi:hypothetical protein